MPFISKITMPSGGNPYDLRDNASMHFLGKTTTDVTVTPAPTTIVIDGNNVDVRVNDLVLYGTNNSNYLYNGTVWVLISESATVPDVPVQDIKVDDVSILNTTTHSADIATTGNYDSDTNPIATQKYVDDAIEDIPEPMIFTGSIILTADSSDTSKASISVSSPASASDIAKGFTYKVTSIAASPVYTGSLKVGDTLIAAKKAPVVTAAWVADTDWIIVPSGDETGYVVGKASGTTQDNLVKWGADGYTIDDAGVAIETTLTTNSNAKVPTSQAIASYISTEIGKLDGVITGSGAVSKTITSLSETDGVVSASFADISIPVSQVNNVSATTTIHNPTKETVAKTVATATPSGTSPDNEVTWCSVQNETLSLYKIGYTTGDSITTTDVSNVVVKTS